jgi:hypothetical protein
VLYVSCYVRARFVLRAIGLRAVPLFACTARFAGGAFAPRAVREALDDDRDALED